MEDAPPAIPDGVTFLRAGDGDQVHRIRGIGNYQYYLPKLDKDLIKLKHVIEFLLVDSMKRAGGGVAALLVLVFALCALPGKAAAQSYPQRVYPPPNAQPVGQTFLDTVFPELGGILRAVRALDTATRPPDANAAAFLARPCRVGSRVLVDGRYYDCVRGAQAPDYQSQVAQFNLLLTTPRDQMFRTRLRWAVENLPVNFAQYYILTTWGCGSGCLTGAAIDTRTGRVCWLPFDLIAQEYAGAGPLEFWPNRNLIITHGTLVFPKRVKRGFPFRYRLRHDRFVYDGRAVR
jgi:hypothetical protein